MGAKSDRRYTNCYQGLFAIPMLSFPVNKFKSTIFTYICVILIPRQTYEGLTPSLAIAFAVSIIDCDDAIIESLKPSSDFLKPTMV